MSENKIIGGGDMSEKHTDHFECLPTLKALRASAAKTENQRM